MSKVTVYPTSANALNIRHPADGPLRETGSEWTNDGFTARMLSDGAVTLEKPSPKSAAAPAQPAADTSKA